MFLRLAIEDPLIFQLFLLVHPMGCHLGFRKHCAFRCYHCIEAPQTFPICGLQFVGLACSNPLEKRGWTFSFPAFLIVQVRSSFEFFWYHFQHRWICSVEWEIPPWLGAPTSNNQGMFCVFSRGWDGLQKNKNSSSSSSSTGCSKRREKAKETLFCDIFTKWIVIHGVVSGSFGSFTKRLKAFFPRSRSGLLWKTGVLQVMSRIISRCQWSFKTAEYTTSKATFSAKCSKGATSWHYFRKTCHCAQVTKPLSLEDL